MSDPYKKKLEAMFGGEPIPVKGSWTEHAPVVVDSKPGGFQRPLTLPQLGLDGEAQRLSEKMRALRQEAIFDRCAAAIGERKFGYSRRICNRRRDAQLKAKTFSGYLRSVYRALEKQRPKWEHTVEIGGDDA